MLRKKSWARTAWVVMCAIWGAIFLFLTIFATLIGGGFIGLFTFILVLLYLGLGLYLYRNYHIDAYFGNGMRG